MLDEILLRYVEKQTPFQEIVEAGYGGDTVKWVIEQVDKNEFKRRQMPSGLIVTTRSFGPDRRMPKM